MVYRPNVGIVLINKHNLIFAGRRINIEFLENLNDPQKGWQMPQGGVDSLDDDVILENGMYRELYEEIGLSPKHVQIIGKSPRVKYTFSKKILSGINKELYGDIVGQEQIYFYLKFLGNNRDFNLETDEHPEFSEWRWVTPLFLIDNVIEMKKEVYRKIFSEGVYVTA